MDEREVGRLWNQNAETWTRLARAGYDVYRDHLNTPAFLAMLPDVRGQSGIDIGCGEGHNTRLLARRGARMTAIDIAETFVRHACAEEDREPLGIEYRVASGLDLPFADATFDFATAFMSLMDMPDQGRALAEACRVLKPGGFLQFSITHPCLDTPHHKNLRDESGRTYAYEVGEYFRRLDGEISEWTFSAAPAEVRRSVPKFRVPRFSRTVSGWLNLLLDTGFQIERVEEPCPSDEVAAQCPAVQDAQVMPYFLHIRARRPARCEKALVAGADMMAACGLDCGTCSIRRYPHDERAAMEAISWYRKMGWLRDAEGIAEAVAKGLICEGCHGDRTRHWSADCWILQCCVDQKGLRHCAECGGFPCERLVAWSSSDDAYGKAFSRLQALRRG